MGIIQKFNLEGKTAIITGSSRGIGKSIAIAFAEQGADIVISCRNQIVQAKEVASQIKALGGKVYISQADLANEFEVQRLFNETIKEFGKIDILVLNASLEIRKSWGQYTSSEIEQQMNINFKASYDLIRLAVTDMKLRGWGRILTVGSVQEIKPHPQMLIYAASKCAQTSLVMSLAKQIAEFGITINNLAPGTIITDRNRGVLKDPIYREKCLSDIPVGYFGEPNDIAPAALFLCSEAGRFVNGESILVDGGMHL